MCGILGWVGGNSVREESLARIQTALERLKNRGPNGNQIEIGADWALGHTRLKILDLTERASQPMRDAEGRWLVFNGEIYNFRELRRELEAKGRSFRSTGDTEVVLQALAEWGLNALSRLCGMFALGWMDPRKRELILARDRFGVKPLVWEKTTDGIRFASDLFALDAMAGDTREIDAEAVRDFLLLGYVPTPRCVWRDCRKVVPGSYLRARWSESGHGDVIEIKYWSFDEIPAAGTAGQGGSIDTQFAERLRAAVQSRLISDVPVGLLLSGGVDSTSVAAACAEVPGQEAHVPAFTMGFSDEASDERIFAREVARSVGLEHAEFLAEEADVAALFERTWTAFDEPFADSSALPMLELCREIGRRVTVAIGGDGGDEVWCGYPWHRALDRAEGASGAVRLALRLGRSLMSPQWRYYSEVLRASDRVEAWATLKTGLTSERARFLPVAAETLPPRAYFESAAKQIAKIEDPLDWAGRMDLLTYLPDDLMVKADRASMRVGLELREPLLDHGFVHWGLTLPINARFNRSTRQGKQLARRYLASRVPARILQRRKKGFTPPLRQWLAGPLADQLREAIRALERGDLHPLVLPAGCRDWSECAAALSDNHQQFLWRIVCFFGWNAGRKDARSLAPGRVTKEVVG